LVKPFLASVVEGESISLVPGARRTLCRISFWNSVITSARGTSQLQKVYRRHSESLLGREDAPGSAFGRLVPRPRYICTYPSGSQQTPSPGASQQTPSPGASGHAGVKFGNPWLPRSMGYPSPDRFCESTLQIPLVPARWRFGAVLGATMGTPEFWCEQHNAPSSRASSLS
jgi:hypothetical protein